MFPGCFKERPSVFSLFPKIKSVDTDDKLQGWEWRV